LTLTAALSITIALNFPLLVPFQLTTGHGEVKTDIEKLT